MTPDSALVGRLRPSPNVNERGEVSGPDILLLHYTGMGSGAGAEAWLADPRSEVSAHYVVHEDGEIVQMVAEAKRAWHAGKGSWRGASALNCLSIGIEIVNGGHDRDLPDYPPVQIDRVVALCRDILSRHAIPPERVLAHSDVAPERKMDPGEKFPWPLLHRHGIGHWVEPVPIDGECEPVAIHGIESNMSPPPSRTGLASGDRGEAVEAFQHLLIAYGYGVTATGAFDETTRFATLAFQRHFRPVRVDGIADRSTVETLRRLIAALPEARLAHATAGGQPSLTVANLR